jgi:RNA polymerase sigma factor (sigma-70 family)
MRLTPDKVSPALETTLARYTGLVRQVGQRHGLSGSDIDEIMQAVRIRLWQALGEDERIATVKPFYVRQAAMSAALDLIRQRRGRKEDTILDCGVPRLEIMEAREAGPGELIERTEVEEAVGRAIDALPARRQPVVRMYLAGYNSSEIAGVFGWSEPKARNLLYRGLSELRTILQAAGLTPETLG